MNTDHEPILPVTPSNPDLIEWLGIRIFQAAWPYKLTEVAEDTWKQLPYGGKMRLRMFKLGIRLAGYRRRVL